MASKQKVLGIRKKMSKVIIANLAVEVFIVYLNGKDDGIIRRKICQYDVL
jgi:hypothetical protein